eukprot:COSAG02_NODE_1859_length_10614_cov_53.814075_11_plen_40_part_01
MITIMGLPDWAVSDANQLTARSARRHSRLPEEALARPQHP